MNQYRKKPVIIEAVQFTGGQSNASEICAWATTNGGKARWRPHVDELRAPNGELARTLDLEHLDIYTLEGTMRANVDDWIIRGVKGEFYPCKPDIFEMTYEPS